MHDLDDSSEAEDDLRLTRMSDALRDAFPAPDWFQGVQQHIYDEMVLWERFLKRVTGATKE